MPLADLLQARFGVRTRAVENPKITSVGTTALLCLANNPNRLGFIIINLSSNIMYASLARDVSDSKGIRLDANGGYWAGIWDELFQAVGWGWWVVADGSPSAIYVLEVLEY